MIYSIDPTPDEIARGCQALVQDSLPRSHATFVLFATYIAAFAAATVFIPSAATPAFVLAVATATVAILGIQAETRARLRRARSTDPHLLETYQVELSAEGIRTWCGHIETRYTWDSINALKETPDFVLFVRGVGGGVYLPKRLFGPDDITTLRSNVATWAPATAGSQVLLR